MRSKLIHSGCVKAMRRMKANSVDAIVCDPPYGLEFMGKSWDKLGDRKLRQRGQNPVEAANRGYNKSSLVKAPGFARTIEASRGAGDWHYRWAVEAFRVLKPGGYLLAFGGTRTFHRLAVAIEDAGFEIRDCLSWMYGSGFPKSMDVSKAIDKAAGAERKVVGPSRRHAGRTSANGPVGDLARYAGAGDVVTAPATTDAEQWEGWGTALKPAWEPIIMARKPLSERTVAANVLEHGTGGININATRIRHGLDVDLTAQQRQQSKNPLQIGGARPGDVLQMYKPEGRWPANVLLSHHPECRRIGTKIDKGHKGYPKGPGGKSRHWGPGTKRSKEVRPDKWEGHLDQIVDAFECHADCPIRLLDAQTRTKKGSGKVKVSAGSKRDPGWLRKESPTGMHVPGKTNVGVRDFGDGGGASRFFYCSKASRSERNAGLDSMTASVGTRTPMAGRGQPGLKCMKCKKWKVSGSPCVCKKPRWKQSTFVRPLVANDHPTVKPVEVMRWLVRMVTPPGGTVLDPFMGSGTTGVACVHERFNFIGIDKKGSYVEIARLRIRHAMNGRKKKAKK